MRREVPNSQESQDAAALIVKKWGDKIVKLSWAIERPLHDREGRVHVEEILMARVRSVKISGRCEGDGPIQIETQLELDTDLFFSQGRISHLLVEEKEEGAVATVYFRYAGGGMPAPDPKVVKIEIVA